MKATTVFTDFSPRQCAAITGLTMDNQRDWRRRELLTAKRNRGASFNTFQLAEVMVMRGLASLGVNLVGLKPGSERGSRSVALGSWALLGFALAEPDAWAGRSVPATWALDRDAATKYLLVVRPEPDLERSEGKGVEVLRPVADMLPALPVTSVDDAMVWVRKLQGSDLATSWGLVDLEALGKQLVRAAEEPLAAMAEQ